MRDFFLAILLFDMSHALPISSPVGTPLRNRTVGELVAERPGRSRIFQALNIDFCCQGARTLQQACERKNIDPELVIAQLDAESIVGNEPDFNPASLPPTELCDYIVETHHCHLRNELPRLHAMSRRVADVHGGHTPSLVEVFEVFCGLEQELFSHMMKEEQILFPAIKSMESEATSMALDGPIACMIHEHEDAGTALERLRSLTHDFQPPQDACNTYRALFSGLQELEEDMHRHIHLENAVLFPAAQAMSAVA